MESIIYLRQLQKVEVFNGSTRLAAVLESLLLERDMILADRTSPRSPSGRYR